MEKDEIVGALRRIIRGQLDDVERAIRNKDERRALNELEDAVTKLKKIINSL